MDCEELPYQNSERMSTLSGHYQSDVQLTLCAYNSRSQKAKLKIRKKAKFSLFKNAEYSVKNFENIHFVGEKVSMEVQTSLQF